jgi:hypothetical protein
MTHDFKLTKEQRDRLTVKHEEFCDKLTTRLLKNSRELMGAKLTHNEVLAVLRAMGKL